MRDPLIVWITHEVHVLCARQSAMALCGEFGFCTSNACAFATAVSELASNLLFHATRGGTISLNVVERSAEIGVEVIAEDQGPGIVDLALAMRDGFTTNGGLGGGLPGARRLMDEFEIQSKVGKGTRIIARMWKPCTLEL